MRKGRQNLNLFTLSTTLVSKNTLTCTAAYNASIFGMLYTDEQNKLLHIIGKQQQNEQFFFSTKDVVILHEKKI